MILTIFSDVESRWPKKRVQTHSLIRFFKEYRGTEVKEESELVGLYKLKKGCPRAAHNVEEIYAFGIDVDSGIDEIDAHDILNGYAYILYHTHTSKDDHHKFRIILPLSRPMTPEENAMVFKEFSQLIDLDTACSDAGRMYYLPSPSKEIKVVDGTRVDVDHIVEKYAQSNRLEALARAAAKELREVRRDAGIEDIQETDLRRALFRIDPDISFDPLWRVTQALRWEVGDDLAFEWWVEWQSGCEDPSHKHRWSEPEKYWKEKYSREPSGQITGATVFSYSSKNSEYSR